MPDKQKSLYRLLRNTITAVLLLIGAVAIGTHGYFSFINIKDTVVEYLKLKMVHIESLVRSDYEKFGQGTVSDENLTTIRKLIADSLHIYDGDQKLIQVIAPVADTVNSDPVLSWMLGMSYPYNTYLQQIGNLQEADSFGISLLTHRKFGFATGDHSVSVIRMKNNSGYIVISPFFLTSIKGLGFSYAPRFYSNLLYLVMLFGCLFFLSRLLLNRIFRPLNTIGETLKEFGNGNFSQRMPVMPYRELNTLVETVNSMADNIERQIESLRLSDKFQRELIANVSHDVKTPLANVIAYIEYSIDTVSPSEEKIQNRLSVALSEANYLQDLIYDLIDLTKLDSKQLVLREEWIHLPELIADLSHTFSTQCLQKNITFKYQFIGSIAEFKTDPLRLLQVLKNILQNAFIHSKPNQSIILKIYLKNHFICFEIEDHGFGISSVDLPNIFDRFYKKNSARTHDRYSGSGLGLYISKGIVEMMSGQITVRSEVERGTTFIIALPYSFEQT